MKYSMYIGGYGNSAISRAELHNGKLRVLESFPAVNASYLALSKDNTKLYAVGETERFRGEYGGSVQSYDIAADQKLMQTSIQPTLGADPCHLVLHSEMLLISNYTSGSISRFHLNENGTVGDALPLIQHPSSPVPTGRQSGPHVHQIQFTPDGRYAVAADLGLDAIYFYPTTEIVAGAENPIIVKTPAGYGPRHMVFPRGNDAWYVLCELRSELLIYRGSPENASLIGRAHIGSGEVKNAPSSLRLSPNGKLLLAAGRGQNILTLFAICANGLLSELTEVSCMGDWPRDAQFSPDGKYIVCANERSNTLTAFEVSGGHLEYLSTARANAPACVLFTDAITE